MSTWLIGYEKVDGTFPNKDTGEVIEYHHRTLKFNSDDAQSPTIRGKSSFEVQKVKCSSIAVQAGIKDDPATVDNYLDGLLDKRVQPIFKPTQNQLVLVGVMPCSVVTK